MFLSVDVGVVKFVCVDVFYGCIGVGVRICLYLNGYKAEWLNWSAEKYAFAIQTKTGGLTCCHLNYLFLV